MKFNYSKLKGRIKEKYGTQENFAKAIGKTQTTTSFKINGKRLWNQKEIIKAIELLDLSKDDIVEYFFNY
ncbi:Cro-like repressor [Streptococcus phage SW19]|uniref:Cro-like repressor n=2 Tax=Aliceevansviridae TaxID=3044455 RepID=A0A3S5H1L4_9CAUD|nr:Cro-like repressor [Streptococcus phage SW19]YP_010683470.1 Cro-like repressor [Streptococcus phage SW15]AYP29610.1 Cro-like repressor [Streptococcus phage SW15]AYP29696.1 Cro-like repressor [Streptococcus phage SW19]